MIRTKMRGQAAELASANNQHFGLCVLDGHYYVGTSDQLRAAGCSLEYPARSLEYPVHTVHIDSMAYGRQSEKPISPMTCTARRSKPFIDDCQCPKCVAFRMTTGCNGGDL